MTNRTLDLSAMLAVFFGALIGAGIACTAGKPASKPTTPPPIAIETTARGCLRFTQRVKPRRPFIVITHDEGCSHFACYDEAGAVALGWYLADLERAIDDALTDCAAPAAETPTKEPAP